MDGFDFRAAFPCSMASYVLPDYVAKGGLPPILSPAMQEVSIGVGMSENSFGYGGVSYAQGVGADVGLL
jgi:hypothetical protein